MNGILSKIAAGLAIAAIIGGVTVYAQIGKEQAKQAAHKELPMHPGAEKRFEKVERVAQEALTQGKVNEAYLKGISEKVGARPAPVQK